MLAETLVRVAAHHVKPLVIHDGLSRTFASLASFLAVLLIFAIYLPGGAFAHPPDARATGVLAAASRTACEPRHGQRRRTTPFRRAE
jgi:hypothetical protein